MGLKGKIRSELASLGRIPKKSLGQNFLVVPAVFDRIVSFGLPIEQDVDLVLEIGGGLGGLTERLISHFSNIKVVEIDSVLSRDLSAKFPDIEIINADVLDVDFASFGAKSIVVFGNIPYSFSSQIVFHLVKHSHIIKRAVLLLQREFADRIAAVPNNRVYGALSVNVQLMANVRLGSIISGRSFYPPAKVDSRIVEFEFYGQPRFEVASHEWFSRVVRASFSKRRKMLRNSLRASGLFSLQGIDDALSAAGIDGKRRPETLSVEEFALLSRCLDRRAA